MLQQNLSRSDFSILRTEVMTIADEIDSQLSLGAKLPKAQASSANYRHIPPEDGGQNRQDKAGQKEMGQK
jgi:hypothetical protein